MSCKFQYFDLSRHPLYIHILDDLVLLQYFNSYFFSCDVMDPELNFAKGSFSNCLSDSIVPNGLSLILTFVATFIPWLSLMPVFLFFSSLLWGINLILNIYIIRISILKAINTLSTLLSFSLVELIRSLLSRNRPK